MVQFPTITIETRAGFMNGDGFPPVLPDAAAAPKLKVLRIPRVWARRVVERRANTFSLDRDLTYAFEKRRSLKTDDVQHRGRNIDDIHILPADAVVADFRRPRNDERSLHAAAVRPQLVKFERRVGGHSPGPLVERLRFIRPKFVETLIHFVDGGAISIGMGEAAIDAGLGRSTVAGDKKKRRIVEEVPMC